MGRLFLYTMRLTYQDYWNQFLRNIGKSGLSATATPEGVAVRADFNHHLNSRYQLVMAKLANYMTQATKTASTVAAQQYYSYPPGIVNIEDAVITVGSVKYPLEVINNQRNWDLLNAITVQATAIPQFVFPRRDDFGIWPIPQDAYTITLNYHIRDRNLAVEDYTTGTVTVTNASTTLTGDSTTFTAGMVGRWFEVTSTTSADYGYWYRIAGFTSTTVLTLEQSWQGTTAGTLSYRIGQCPEIPEEGHIVLLDGVTADFYAGYKDDIEQAVFFENKFWTGSGTDTNRKEGDPNIRSGLIGLVNLYADRNQTKIINRRPRLNPLGTKIFATTLS